MSGNRRKSATPKPIVPVEEPIAARVVAIPKTEPPVAANAPRPEAKPAAKPKSDRIGDILRQARVERNDDLYQIAEYLCIKPAFLIALENSRYDEFPADAYVIGFLRTYASFLGVDGKDAVDRYRYEMAGRRKKPVLAMPIPLTEGRAPTGIILVGATVALLLVYALWYGISSANRTEVNAPPTLPVSQQAAPESSSSAAGLTVPVTAAPAIPAPAAATATVGSSSATSAAAIPLLSPGIVVTASDVSGNASATKTTDMMGKESKDAKDTAAAETPGKKQVYGDPDEASHIIIRSTQSSWIMVSDASGKTIFDHVLKPGDIYKVPNKSGLSLTTGNGNGIVLALDGVDLPKVATGAPHVVKNIPLDPDRLTTESAQ